MRRVLFICTGNYYRSRFAEAVFNHHAERLGLGWAAFSRGLATELAQGDLSPLTATALAERAIEAHRHTAPTRVPLCEADLDDAQVCIALKDAEHRPMIVARFPQWEGRVRFWSVSDIDQASPDEALPMIERLVLALIEELRGEEAEPFRSRSPAALFRISEGEP
jgi:protein-tyrosine phosphatase